VSIYRMSHEERSIFWEVTVSVILSKKSVYVHVSYSEQFPRQSCVLFERGVLFCLMCVICVLCLIVVPPPPGKNPFAVKINK
jgi:hypothetical protein